jgi:hypothetical protein
MKKLLIVSPNFPPADAPDAHRVRMNASTYRSAGWEPTVLCVHHGDTGRTVDLRLLQTLPEGLRVESVQADDTTWARRLGISAIGLRAYRSLGAAGDELLSNGRFDLVFISTTAFPLMALGRRWLRSFGVPFVLDMQDPWYTSPPESIALQRPGARHAAMRRVHRFLEQGTMPEAGGIISVSPRYVEALRQRYPQLRERPSEVVPFGFSRNDLAVARAVGRPWPALAEARGRGRIVAFSAGRVNDSMASSLETLLKVLQQRTAGGTAMFGRLSLMFLGTEYGASPGVGRIATLAARMGLADRVTEQASRLPLLDAFRSLYDAEVLIVLGSRDLAYQPSRFYQCVSIGKPVIVVAPREGVLARECEKFPNVAFLPSEPSQAELESFERAFGATMARAASNPEEVERAIAPYESAQLGATEAALFDRVVREHASRGLGA